MFYVPINYIIIIISIIPKIEGNAIKSRCYSELFALRMTSYTTLGAKSTFVKVCWGLFADKEMTIEDGGNKYRTEISIKGMYLILIFSKHLTIHT